MLFLKVIFVCMMKSKVIWYRVLILQLGPGLTPFEGNHSTILVNLMKVLSVFKGFLNIVHVGANLSETTRTDNWMCSVLSLVYLPILYLESLKSTIVWGSALNADQYCLSVHYKAKGF